MKLKTKMIGSGIVLAIVVAVLVANRADNGGGVRQPDSDTPTAGICGTARGDVATVLIVPGVMPEPRCLKIGSDQQLVFSNTTSQRALIDLGRKTISIDPGSEMRFDASARDYFAPGVHRLVLQEGIGAIPELWVTR